MNSEKPTGRPSHPKKKANILSVLTYCWTIPVFIKGFSKDLQEEDLFETLNEHRSSELGSQLEQSWNKELKLHQSPSLLRALARVFGLELAIYGFLLIFLELFLKMVQPLALSQLLLYYTSKETQTDKMEAFKYASVIVASCFTYTVTMHWYSLSLQHFGMKLRVASCSLIYRKALRLSTSAVGETSKGQMVNLLSNDVNRFDQAAVNFHYLWFVPIETAIIVYILYRLLGPTSAVGVLIMTCFVPLQVYLGKTITNLRFKTALKTDYRIQLTNEIISGIQVIKMYTWEKQFETLIGVARKLELDKIRATSYVRGVMMSFVMFTTRFAVFSSILVYVLLGNDLKAEHVFVLISFYNILRKAVTRYYPQGIAQVGEAYASITRIQKFLLHEEIKSVCQTPNNKVDKQQQNVGITFENVSATWSTNSSHRTLSGLNLDLRQGHLVAVTGPVGSGKTSLLSAILKELPLEEGAVAVTGRVSYASQEPWLFSGTIRQNVLFGQPMNRERYEKVVDACALKKDLATFLYGDETFVGERGVTLSGGQKARIGLARAVYKEADVYLLDDPLSAVDVQVGRKIFENCILNFLKDKCVVLVTHQVQFLNNVQEICLMENGHISSGISQNRLEQIKGGSVNGRKASEVVRCENEKNSEEDHQPPVENKEQRSFGKVSGDVYISYLGAARSVIGATFVLCMFISTQALASAADYFIAYWVNLEKTRYGQNDTQIHDGIAYYLPREACIYTYSAIIISTVFITLIRSFSFFKYCMEASKKLHNDMFSSIIHAPMSFFNANSSGRILNRFSKDMGSVDETLPTVIIDFVQIGLQVAGVTIVISFVNPWMLGVTAVILVIFYMLRIVYLSTSRSIKRLDGITRSPVLAHMNASIQGLTTIRAFGAQEILQKEFDDQQDLHSSTWYLYLCCTRAFGFWLDTICTLYIGIITFSFLFMKNDEHGGNIGLAITQAISLTGILQWGMRQWSELENQMTSVERIAEYSKIEPEATRMEMVQESSWPEKGKIDFISVTLKYSPVEPHVLNQLSFSIKSNEKVGIVGRTGAGKTSLICALFQLAETEGAILIDGVDISKVPLQILRSKISIIPQEPFLFSGTLRKNLNPFDEYSDVDLWNALAEVELKEHIASLPSGLDENISEGGSNFSVGQRQLICLARAIVRRNKILIMDEATANLDSKTDDLIQATIRRRFSDCTVLTIAHRLHTVMDSDRILMMDNGKVVEFDPPRVLMKDENSLFYSMVHQNDNSVIESFIEVVENSHNKANSIE